MRTLLVLSFAWALCGAETPFTHLDRYLPPEDRAAWPASELERFRTFPRLDRAYRLLHAQRLREALAEIQTVEAQYPDNLRVAALHLTILDSLGDHTGAIREGSKLLAHMPRFVPALLYRGRAYAAAGGLQRAAADFAQLAAIESLTAEDRIAALEQLTELALRTADTQTALSALSRLSTLRTDFRDAMRRGIALERAGRITDAEAAYHEAQSLARNNGQKLDASRSLALTAARAQHWIASREAAEIAAELDTHDASLLATLAYAEYRLDQTGDALRHLRASLAIRSDPARRLFLGGLLLGQGELTAARDQFELLLAEKPGAPQEAAACRSLSQIAESQGDMNAAASWWQRAEQREPSRTGAEHGAGLLLKSGRVAEGAEVLSKLLRDPKDAEEKRRLALSLGHAKLTLAAYAEAAQAFTEAEDYEAAANAVEQAGDLAAAIAFRKRLPQTPDELIRLARLYARSGQPASAAELLARVPATKESARELGYARLKTGDADGAADSFATAMRLGDSASWRALATAQERAGRFDEAAATYTRALSGMTNPDAETLAALATVEAKRARHADAARRYVEAFRREARSEWLAAAGESLMLAKQPADAARVYRQLLECQDISTADRAHALTALSMASIQRGDDESAVKSLRRAIALGDGQASNQLALGYALYRLGRWDAALDAFRQVSAGEPHVDLAAAQCYRKLGQREPAIAAFRNVLHAGGLTQGEQRQANIELGYLHAESHDYAAAAQAWRAARNAGAGPEVGLLLARADRLSGDADAARAELTALEPGALPERLTADYFDESAQLYTGAGRLEEALADWRSAARIAPSPRRSYEAGLCHYKLHQPELAIPHLEAARDSDPKNTVYVQTLAQAYESAGRLGDAVAQLAPIAANTADYRQLAYLEMRRSHSAQAAAWFRKAIDSAPADAGAGALREDLTRLAKRFFTTMYYGYSDDQVSAGASGLNASTVMPAGSGVEFSFQPPLLGFRNERTLQVFARAVWNARPGRFAPQSGSQQGGAGVRYKPLARSNLQVSVESLIPLADGGRRNWLARAMYSWGTAIPRDPERRHWHYRELFLDSPVLLAAPRYTVQYAQYRHGVTFRAGDAFHLTPLVVAVARHQAPNSAAGSFWEAGPGISLRYLFHETEYSPRTASVELLFDCHRGNLLGRAGRPSFQGCSATAITRF